MNILKKERIHIKVIRIIFNAFVYTSISHKRADMINGDLKLNRFPFTDTYHIFDRFIVKRNFLSNFVLEHFADNIPRGHWNFHIGVSAASHKYRHDDEDVTI